MERNIYLTDEQYLSLLIRQRDRITHIKEASGEDSTHSGDKYTVTNVGLCDELLTTKDTALWPEDFPQRKSMKYRKKAPQMPT